MMRKLAIGAKPVVLTATRSMGGGKEFLYPKWVWSPAGLLVKINE